MTNPEHAFRMQYSEDYIKRLASDCNASDRQSRHADLRLDIAKHALQGLLSFRDYYDQTTEPCHQALALADELLRQANQKP